MFIGEYPHNMDKKGRINVPSKLREALGTSFIITKGLDGCIYAFHKENWKQFEEKFAEAPMSSADARKFTRYFFSSAAECEPDDLGRIIIPKNLREHAGLEREIVSIGNRDRAEIWDRDRWDAYNEAGGYDDDEIAEKMAEFGI